MKKNNKKTDSVFLSEKYRYLLGFGYSALFIIGLTIFCRLVGYPLIIPLLLYMMGLYLKYAGRGNTHLFLQLGLILSIVLFTNHIIYFYTDIPHFYAPVAGGAVLTMLLFNSLRTAFIIALTSSVVVTLVLNGGMEMLITFFMGSIAGAFSVREARTRGQLMSAGFAISLVNVVCLFLFNPDWHTIFDASFKVNKLYPLLANGFITAVFLVFPTLKIFEYLFGVVTNYSLLELSDFNHPLLKRMIMEAPGTYQHSLMVSNLAEAAADAIGAHALLTRVGAYYHDIGKLVKPEYFSENQLAGRNLHDQIEPSVSRLVILNHVKEGIEIAKKAKLNPRIIDFIPQHHGTSLIYFFYQRSLAAAQEGEVINEEHFRYPGPKPQTRETAITLLADSVEGATRALSEPNPQNIEETVKKIINNKFIDGQLDECPLTLKEIDKISSTFIRILSAMYHGRVKYPEKRKMNIEIENLQTKLDLDLKVAGKVIRKILSLEKAEAVGLNMIFITRQRIQALNHKYLTRTYATDVLAFENDPFFGQKGSVVKRAVAGDIFISTDAAIQRASEFDSSIDRELCLYMVHGILHLLGFDDHSPEDVRRMRGEEAKVMSKLESMISGILLK